MRMYWLAACAASVMCAACEVGIGDVPDHRPDAAKALTVLDGRALDIDAAVDAKPERTLSQTTNNAIVQNNGLACLNYGYTDEASYYRVFDLAAFGITEPFHVSFVHFGVESATGSQTVEVKLGTYAGTPGNQLDTGTTDFGGLVTQLGVTTAAVPPTQNGVVVTAEVEVEIPANGKLIVEIKAPSHVGQPISFFHGATNAGQTAPAYLRAPVCNIGRPTATAAFGFPNSHLLISVSGSY